VERNVRKVLRNIGNKQRKKSGYRSDCLSIQESFNIRFWRPAAQGVGTGRRYHMLFTRGLA